MGNERKNLVASYDLSLNPLSFDFVNFLAMMRGICHKLNLDKKFDLIIKAHSFKRANAGIEDNYPEFHRKQKFNNIILRIAGLCTWVNSFYVLRDSNLQINLPCAIRIPSKEMLERAQTENLPHWMLAPMTGMQLSKMVESGGKIPNKGFIPNEFALNHYKKILGDKSIVLHPRCSMFSEDRNTPIPLFQEIANYFDSRGYKVMLVPDYEDYMNKFLWQDAGINFEVCPATDIDQRLAIAEAASVNLVWNGGLTTILHFSEAKFLETGNYIKENLVCSLDYFKRKGPTYGVQPNWLEKYQVLDWTEKADLSPKLLIEKLESILKN